MPKLLAGRKKVRKVKLNEGKTALVVGVFVALIHAIWSLMVVVGLAQVYLDWILGLHFVSNPYVVQPFTINTALILVGFTFIVGYAFGWVFAILWNRLHRG